MQADSDAFGIMPFPVRMKHFIDAISTDTVKDTEFRPFDIPFISVIGRFDGISQKDISAVLDYDKSYTTRIINHLIEIGAVENRASGKTHSLHLTAKGMTALELSVRVSERIEEAMFRGFTEEEKNLFVDLTSRMAKNMSDCLSEM